MCFQAFVAEETTRRRYWARSMIGWRRFGQALPNDAHHALARLEAKGQCQILLTQNVDRLTVDQELLARNEYLAAENRILKAQLKGRLKLSDAERATLGEIGHRVGRKVLAEVATVARPDTILAWYRKLVACKFDGSQVRHGPGRSWIKREVEQLIVRMAGENRDWGHDRIVGALANLGYMISDQTIGSVLQRHALPPAPERKRTTTWPVFI